VFGCYRDGILFAAQYFSGNLLRVFVKFFGSRVLIFSAGMSRTWMHAEKPQDRYREAFGDRCLRQDLGESFSIEYYCTKRF